MIYRITRSVLVHESELDEENCDWKEYFTGSTASLFQEDTNCVLVPEDELTPAQIDFFNDCGGL